MLFNPKLWLYPCIEVAVTVALSAPLQLCGSVINKVHCDNFSIIKLACSDTTVNNIYGLVYMFTVIFSLIIIIILYTYTRILIVCFSGSKQTRQKAVSTCSPHLASLLNFSFGCFFEDLQSRLNINTVPHMLHIVLSLYFLTRQPLFNAVLYGLKMSEIRTLCKRLVFDKL